MNTQYSYQKTGIFICHCGHNIAGKIRIAELVHTAEKWPGVVSVQDVPYLCSEPGQKQIQHEIDESQLEAIVVASCSPRLHQQTFRGAVYAAGMNPHRLEIANIREQCAWVHDDEEMATSKAIRIVRAMVAKAQQDRALEDITLPVTEAALVIGGGIAGIQAALDIANAGYKVYLVEREASIGGNMARLSETFPTLDCAQCILSPKMTEAGQHPNIELLTRAELDKISGYIGNYQATIKLHPKYVDWNRCNGCGTCIESCVSKGHRSEFNLSLGNRPAIYTSFPQAVPNKPIIDKENCTWFGPLKKSGKHKCGICEKKCPTDAILFDDQETYREIEVGTVIATTGFQLYDRKQLPEYGASKLENVIDSLQFERLLSASGPTNGDILRPSDGEPVESVAFIQCVGSRDERHNAYCSKICCMVTAKQVLLYKQRVPEGQAYVFYIDLRTAGRDYEEFLVRAQQTGTRFIRGKATSVVPDKSHDENTSKLLVRAEDTLTATRLEVPVDLVVLATSVRPSKGLEQLAQTLKAPLTPEGFLAEAHIKLRPVESMASGIFIAGAVQGPRDISETVAQASAAAGKVLSLFAQGSVTVDPSIATTKGNTCIGCGLCLDVCPPEARFINSITRKAEVIEAKCQGCGACAPSCPTGAADILNFSDQQIMSMIESILQPRREVNP